MNSMNARHPRRYAAVAAVLVVGLVWSVGGALGGTTARVAAVADQTLSDVWMSPIDAPPGFDVTTADPTQTLSIALERCVREVRDYRCVFVRQERLGGKLSAEQAVRVLYRDEPRSVYMTWIRNADRVRRVLYVKGLHLGSHGEEQALVEPAGAIIRLFIDELKVPIRGPEARKSSRHYIDDFGFRAVLERLNRDNRRFAEQGVLDCRYVGEGKIGGRPTHVLVRHLPYTGPNGEYPDARQVLHLDQQWLLPLAIYSYADNQETVLLGSYVSTRVRLNEGLDNEAFRF